MSERKILYIVMGALGALVPGVEVLLPLLGQNAVAIVQWAAGGIIAALTAWRAYIDQHESRAGRSAPPPPPAEPQKAS